MASITDLAKMYRQRVPTTTTTSRTGPRQTTVDDVRRVATYGRSAMTPSYVTADPRAGGLPTSRPISTFQSNPGQLEELQAGIIGGPGLGYGEKNGGFSTWTNLLRAVEGEAYGTREVEALARQKAEQAIADRAGEYIDPIMPELSRSASMAGVRPGALASEADRAKLMGGYERVQQYGNQPEYQQVREEERQLAREQEMARRQLIASGGMALNAPTTPSGSLANQMMRAAYEDMYYSPEYSPEDRRTVADIAEQQQVNLPSVQQYGQLLQSPEVAGPRQLADLIASTPISEYAQQIAQARYGMDPNLARGVFGTDLDMQFAADQINAQQMAENKPMLSDDQLAWQMLGPEGYAQYREQKILDMVYGSPEEQAKAEEDAINLENDLAIQDNFGFMPSDISGVKAETLREVLQNPDVEQYVKQGIVTLRDTEKLAADYAGSAKALGNQLAQDWMKAGGDPVEAQIIQRIFSSFDFVD